MQMGKQLMEVQQTKVPMLHKQKQETKRQPQKTK
jgi:hypothetical protein